jgi:hypothetical protein
MKGKKRKRPARPSLDLIKKETATGKIITFPGVQGRTVETIRLYTNTDDHSIAIHFADQTFLSLHFEPGFVVKSSLYDSKGSELRTIKEWPPILGAPRNPA